MLCRLATLELRDGALGPYRPMAEQTAPKIRAGGDALVAQVEWKGEVEQNVVVIARVERDPIERASCMDAPQYVQRAVTIERCDFDCDHIVNLCKAPPEIRCQDHAADRGLQVKADERDFACDRLAMHNDLVLRSRLHGGETEEPCVIADAAGSFRLRNGLSCRPGKARYQRQGTLGPA